MNRTDLADPHSGILASFDQHRPLAVFERGASGQNARFELEASGQGPQVEFGDPDLLGTWTVAAQRLTGRLLGGDGSTTRIDALGASTGGRLEAPENGDDASDPAVLRRNIIICFEDTSLLALVAAKTDNEDPHSREQMASVLVTSSGTTTTFAQPLLSTEYDAGGRQRRATLELRPTEEQDAEPLRGGGVAVAVTEFELSGAISTLAFFEWSIAGRHAIGRYEIIRAL